MNSGMWAVTAIDLHIENYFCMFSMVSRLHLLSHKNMKPMHRFRVPIYAIRFRTIVTKLRWFTVHKISREKYIYAIRHIIIASLDVCQLLSRLFGWNVFVDVLWVASRQHSVKWKKNTSSSIGGKEIVCSMYI